MTDRPIIFSAPMVKALLAGRKTQTRRLAWRDPFEGGPGEGLERRPSPWHKVQPGDRLWVRETWVPTEFVTGDGQRFLYRADADDDGTVPYLVSGTPSGGGVGNARIDRWRPSIHMPRWASRITLTVTDVRVQRLQEISALDAAWEGLQRTASGWWSGAEGQAAPTTRAAFALLWNSLHGAGAWDANPEVVALTFTVEQRNIDA